MNIVRQGKLILCKPGVKFRHGEETAADCLFRHSQSGSALSAHQPALQCLQRLPLGLRIDK
jgi:hypothetical protein